MKLLSARYIEGGDYIILCECGELVEEDTFKDYIQTSANPSTRTIGHRKCGIIFNFIDGKSPKKYSSRKELKILAAKFAGKNELLTENTERFLLEVDRLKSCGQFSDAEILVGAYKKILEAAGSEKRPESQPERNRGLIG
ncbi:hypothetical protein [Methanosarcina sp.]|uniref:hypothetical protein n=1 Tax=Methanosarcina sp. TaxID=2213 RepID=UPI003C725A74